MLVLDCSMTLSWCFSDESSTQSDRALDQVTSEGALVPSLWGYELSNGLLQATRRQRLTLNAAVEFLELFSRLPIQVSDLSASESLVDVWKVAHEHNLSTYDAAYLHLALREKLPLATLDKALQRAAKSEGIDLI